MEVMNPSVQSVYGCDEQRAWFCDAPMLCTMDAAYGEGSAVIWLVPELTDLCAKCGVKGKLDDRQMTEMAKMIRTEFGFLKASEVMLFFYNLKAGHYGEFFGSVDTQRVMRALREPFMRERAKAIDDREKAEMWAEREQWAKNALKPDQIRELKERLNKIKENLTK